MQSKRIIMILVTIIMLLVNTGTTSANSNDDSYTQNLTSAQGENNVSNLIPNQDINSAEVINSDEGNVPAGIMSVLGKITDVLAIIASTVCLFKLIQIGIMYMLTGANEKSNAKTAILPWLIGTIVCVGYVTIGNSVIEMIKGGSGGGIFGGISPEVAVKEIGGKALDIIGIVAIAVAVGMVIYVGIKYIFSGAGGMAKAKTNVLPLIIGLVIVGSASRIVSSVTAVASNGADMETIVVTIAQSVISLLRVIATAGAFGMLIFTGIKYMLKGAGAKAEAKNTLLPWLIGCVLVASATTIVDAFISGGGSVATQNTENNATTTETNQNMADWRDEVAQ